MPVVVQRHVLGSARGVPAPLTVDVVEEIPLVRVFVEQIVVCQCQIMEGFRRAADHGGNRGGDSAWDKLVEMLVIVQRQVGGESSVVQLSWDRPVLGQGC